jgi:hypothetical protein
MTDNREWRDASPEEIAVVTAIVSTSAAPDSQALIDELDGALVSHSTPWILDIKPKPGGPGVDLPNGPFPARAYVPSKSAYQGEIIVWIADGHLSGLEYAWVTDDPPTRWPRPDELEVARD